jgi:hypothetical protein
MNKREKYNYDELLQMALNVVKEAEKDAKVNPTSDSIQVVIVEPFKKPYKKTIPNNLEAMQGIVGGYIENLFIGRTDKAAQVGIVLNEEGKLKDLPMNRRLVAGNRSLLDFIVGTFFITAYNLQGDNISLTDQEAEKYIKRFASIEVYI